jgi:regulatory protein YycI of two-component signal transduction system YycFG
MAQLIESIPLSSNDDVTRFIQFFEDKIKNGSLEKYKSFDKTKNKVKLLKDET